MKSRITTLSLSTLLVLCITHTGQVETTLEEFISTTTRLQGENHLVDAMNEFGYQLLVEMMRENENSNVVISPTGIGGLLAMTLLGSVGDTYDELATTLGFSQDVLINRLNHEQLGRLLQVLNANDTSSKTIYADAVYVDLHTQLREVYRSYLTRVYQGDAVSTDFADAIKSKEAINEWVKNHTSGQITNFLKEPLPTETTFVLLTALYFKGQWKHPFIPEYTKKMPFNKPGGLVIMADLMLNMGEFDYIFSAEDGLHMISLPYNDSVTNMYIIKPRIPKLLSLPDLMNRLNYSKIDNLIDKMIKKKSIIRFPKMEIMSSVKLETPLKAIGLKSIFIPGKANFALMADSNTVMNKTEDELISRLKDGGIDVSKNLRAMLDNLPNPGIHVDSIIHDVQLSINEYGTEAVAATSGILARSAELFYADSPFYIFIRNERTKLVTFSALIFDPTA